MDSLVYTRTCEPFCYTHIPLYMTLIDHCSDLVLPLVSGRTNYTSYRKSGSLADAIVFMLTRELSLPPEVEDFTTDDANTSPLINIPQTSPCKGDGQRPSSHPQVHSPSLKASVSDGYAAAGESQDWSISRICSLQLEHTTRLSPPEASPPLLPIVHSDHPHLLNHHLLCHMGLLHRLCCKSCRSLSSSNTFGV